RSSLSSPGVVRRPARATGDGLAVVGQQPTSQGTELGRNDNFGSCNLDSIHQGYRLPRGPTCFLRKQERMIMFRIFSSAEPGPQLTWTAMRRTETYDGRPGELRHCAKATQRTRSGESTSAGNSERSGCSLRAHAVVY